MAKKARLDARVIELGLFASRQTARTAIMDGGILVDGQPITKPGTSVSQDSRIEVRSGWGPGRFVSRGGLKLEKALDSFAIDPAGQICLDVGASTGGFTDCLLKHGAALVYAIDVGYGQLDWSLRQNPKVIVRERLNARYLTCEQIYEEGQSPASLATIDVSFISLTKILPACLKVLNPSSAGIVALIKPQFEAGKSMVGKGGVVRDAAVHARIIETLIEFAGRLGLTTDALTHSPVKGPAGNIEFLILWTQSGTAAPLDIVGIVDKAHEELRA